MITANLRNFKPYENTYTAFPDKDYYVFLFNELPSIYQFHPQVNGDIYEYLIGEGFILKSIFNSDKKFDARFDLDERFYINNEKQVIVYTALSKIENNAVHISLEILYSLNNKIFSIENFIKNVNKYKIFAPKANIKIITNDSGALGTVEFQLKNPEVNIELNYGKDFLKKYEVITEKLNSDNGKGIVLLHGHPGSGKTTLLRKLANDIKNKEVIFVPPAMAEILTDPTFISFLIEKKNSILIIEDGEKAISDRTNPSSTIAVSNILNITDGILSDCLGIQVVITFNTDKSNIDPALLRKGRLIAEHKFEKLNIDDTNRLLEYLGKKIITKKEMSLAEIYNIDDDDFSETQSPKKIGFDI